MRYLKEKWKSSGGYSLAETLVAVLILLLVSAGLATGMTLASRQYRRSILSSESKILASTLNAVIENELANTPEKKVDGGSVYFYSPNYGGENRTFCLTEESNGYGKVALADSPDGTGDVMPLVSSSCYANGMGAKVSVTWEGSGRGYFHVVLTIGDSAGEELLTTTSDVLPLNDLS